MNNIHVKKTFLHADLATLSTKLLTVGGVRLKLFIFQSSSVGDAFNFESPPRPSGYFKFHL